MLKPIFFLIPQPLSRSLFLSFSHTPFSTCFMLAFPQPHPFPSPMPETEPNLETFLPARASAWALVLRWDWCGDQHGLSAWRSVGHRRGMVVVVLGFVGLSCVKFVGLGMIGGFLLVVVWLGSTSLMMVVTIMAMVAGGSGG